MSRQAHRSKVVQRQSHDCGLACLAMVACLPYETVEAAFHVAGLTQRRQGRVPFSSNFEELMAVAKAIGLAPRMRRFRGWEKIGQLAVVKVCSCQGRGRDWHWVVAQRGPNGIEILDPATDLPSFERLPEEVLAIEFSYYRPVGNFVEFLDELSPSSISRTRSFK
jgi:ABC-type bacteriocin/lantibiotic exporter with double-glycine peptidase domain